MRCEPTLKRIVLAIFLRGCKQSNPSTEAANVVFFLMTIYLEKSILMLSVDKFTTRSTLLRVKINLCRHKKSWLLMAELGKNIAFAQALLNSDELVGVPTETVYGLAGNALKESVLAKIFEVKQRPAFDPLIVHISNAVEVEKYAHAIPNDAYILMRAFWPGPLTLVLKKKNIIPDLATSGHPTVALRVPQHPMLLELLQLLPYPLAAPSANPFGFTSPTCAEHVNAQLGHRINYVLDGGACQVGLESTIVSFASGEPEVLRLGGLALEEIEEVLGYKLNRVKTSSSNPTAPGMLLSHYNPGKKIIVGKIAELIIQNKGKRLGILSFSKEYKGDDIELNIILSSKADVVEAAQNLFSALRKFSSSDVDCILTEFVPSVGIGKAINDRLTRAARY